MLRFNKSSAFLSTVMSQQHGIMMSQYKMMKNTYIKVATKFQGSTILQRKDIVDLIQKVAKQWKLRSNGHLTYTIGLAWASVSLGSLPLLPLLVEFGQIRKITLLLWVIPGAWLPSSPQLLTHGC